ncbi:MAG TPA: FHA domain-containing protein [Polyangiaceae bacterium]|nr:FHA domain-containing protein [Polyangiaceae bacterium]
MTSLQSQILKFVIQGSDGQIRELVVDSDTALIGSGAHCEIRLSSDDAAVEQLRVEARSGGVFAEVRSLDPATLLNGAPFAQGRLLPDSLLRIGRTEISVSSGATEAAAQHAKKRQERSGNPLIYAMGAIGCPFGFYMLFVTQPEASALPRAVPPPALWAEDASECRERETGAALVRGERARMQADSARERAPFRPEDGVLAVDLYARAAACLASANRPEEGAAARSAGESLRRKVASEFHVHQVRLERALATKRYDQARTELRVLLSFVGRRGGEYADWLSNLDRQIELKFSGKKR